MSLQIKNNNGVLEIYGKLVGENALLLEYQIQQFLYNTQKVIICLNQITSIDTYGIIIINKLYQQASTNNKIFSVITNGNEKVSKAIGPTDYIL